MSRQSLGRPLDHPIESPGGKHGQRYRDQRYEPPAIVPKHEGEGSKQRHMNEIEAERDSAEPLQRPNLQRGAHRAHTDGGKHQTSGTEHRELGQKRIRNRPGRYYRAQEPLADEQQQRDARQRHTPQRGTRSQRAAPRPLPDRVQPHRHQGADEEYRQIPKPIDAAQHADRAQGNSRGESDHPIPGSKNSRCDKKRKQNGKQQFPTK